MKKETLVSRDPESGVDDDRRRMRPDDALEAGLALDDTGVEDDEEALEEPSVRYGARSRSSGVAPRGRDVAIPRPGSLIAGKYRVERVLEEAGAVVVLQALHVGLEQLVTVKCLLPTYSVRPDAVTRFLRSARTAVQIQSEHAARIIDVGRMRSGAPFIVTEELSGWELDEVLRVRGPLPVQEAVEYVVQAAEAIAEAHGLGIVHGALNLENVVLTRRSDDSPLVKVLGFGSALPDEIPLGDEPGTFAQASGFMTVLPYLAPEQIRGVETVDERADVWALGALLHTLLSGAPPFRAKNALALLAVVSADTPKRLSSFRDDVAPELESTVFRCLEKDPSQRFANMAELVLALKPFAPGDSQGAVERISKMYGRATRPPPLPTHARAIVPVATRTKTPAPAPAAAPPAPAAAQSPSRWLLAAAGAGGAIGAVCAAITVVSLSPAFHPPEPAPPVAQVAPTYAPALAAPGTYGVAAPVPVAPAPFAPAAPLQQPVAVAPAPQAVAPQATPPVVPVLAAPLAAQPVAARPTAAAVAAAPAAPVAAPAVAAAPRAAAPAPQRALPARVASPSSERAAAATSRTPTAEKAPAEAPARTASAGADLFADTK
ncbi:MAG TPA: serine/threonine-protein kinase [Polyangiaceae bacterium]|nr:serine/threonine-protein kinase [Polyangiaceae bacterium]